MENSSCNQYGEKFYILNIENIKICGGITKLEVTKLQLVCTFVHLPNIWRKFESLVFQGSVATCLR